MRANPLFSFQKEYGGKRRHSCMMIEQRNLFVPDVVENLRIIHACEYVCKSDPGDTAKVSAW